jgi:hypothetical protein
MAVTLNSITICRECDDDLEHCHGTAIMHADFSYDCSEDPDCRVPVELHLFATWEEIPAEEQDHLRR